MMGKKGALADAILIAMGKVKGPKKDKAMPGGEMEDESEDMDEGEDDESMRDYGARGAAVLEEMKTALDEGDYKAAFEALKTAVDLCQEE